MQEIGDAATNGGFYRMEFCRAAPVWIRLCSVTVV